ncbi:MAG: 50S ribosomal protein L21 [Thermoleophilaceae bacterium]|jgi:large subunit ribosomal protein L21
MYAIVKVGGKQYRVEKGDSLVVDRLRDDEGAKVALEPLLYRSDGDAVFDADSLRKVKVEAVVASHERGKKIHVLKFKPKRGYKRRSGHRSELTRLEIKDIKMLSRKPGTKKAETATAGKEEPSHVEAAGDGGDGNQGAAESAKSGSSKSGSPKSGPAKSRSTRKTSKEAQDGS